MTIPMMRTTPTPGIIRIRPPTGVMRGRRGRGRIRMILLTRSTAPGSGDMRTGGCPKGRNCGPSVITGGMLRPSIPPIFPIRCRPITGRILPMPAVRTSPGASFSTMAAATTPTLSTIVVMFGRFAADSDRSFGHLIL